MRLYIIRHADPDYDRNTITARGHQEAKALAEFLKKEGLDRIYYSPLGRARDTMQYTAELLNIVPNLEEWTTELYHEVELDQWGKMPINDIPGEVVRCLEPGASHECWNQREPYKQPVFQDMIEKIKLQSDEFIFRHGYKRMGERFQCIKPNKEKIAVFCHLNVGLTWLSYLLGIPSTLIWSGFWLAPSSVTTVLFEERSSSWAVPRCIGLGDVSHLRLKDIEISPRGLYGKDC